MQMLLVSKAERKREEQHLRGPHPAKNTHTPNPTRMKLFQGLSTACIPIGALIANSPLLKAETSAHC
ncbi:Hypothetical predicted protein [Podarcis lilfordi]|uniref:Uncharacterized protein n=1 Tax=Podarcis lilfordi TaxID=74358 RepID=A0AA35KJF5_9SAUR|nr:Hypothetical predicted protein [Podarcis lilfordi]